MDSDSGDRIKLNFEIADGYYLYQEKFSLDAGLRHYAYTDLALPEGKTVEDPLFGQVVTYIHKLDFEVPADTDVLVGDLTVNFQGCNKPLGVCYPPQSKSFSLIAQARAEEPPQGSASSGIFNQGSLFGGASSDDFLPVDEAFNMVVTATDPQRVVANFEAADGYYLYQPHIKFNSGSSDIAIASVEYPQGIMKQDPHFGEIEVYYGIATIPLELARMSASQDFKLTVQYQGCAEDGICYPPQTRDVDVVLASFDGPFANNSPASSTADSGQPLDKSLFWYLLAAFGGGLLLTFTPCVLPMIPILSGIIMSESGKGGGRHAGLLSGKNTFPDNNRIVNDDSQNENEREQRDHVDRHAEHGHDPQRTHE